MPSQKTVPVGQLRPNPWNTNFVSPENEVKLVESIRQFGLFKPIVVRQVDEHFEILGGEHRWEGAKAAGLVEVPIYDLGIIDDEKAKKISLVDNARYGADNALDLAELMKEIGTAEDFQNFLPFSDADVKAIFASATIAGEELDLDEDDFNSALEEPEIPAAAKPAKTHTIMRVKLLNADAERLTKLIAKTQKDNGFTGSDELTNAGDAIVHLLLGSAGAEA